MLWLGTMPGKESILKWTQQPMLLFQTGIWTSTGRAEGINISISGSKSLLLNFRCDMNGFLHFRLMWPDFQLYEEWVQTSNPQVDPVIAGYASNNYLQSFIS